MWRLDWGRATNLIRIGAQAVELWRGDRSVLTLVLQLPLPRRGSLYDADSLNEPLLALLARLDGEQASVILESAFAPVLLADTGGGLTSGTLVTALLRHRFGLAYAEHGVDIASWKIRTDYRFGDRYALGFALPPAVETVLVEVSSSAGIAFTEWRPALAWSLDRLNPARGWVKGSGWWIWREQDRSLIVRLDQGRVAVLNPAVQIGEAVSDVERSIATELVGSGIARDTGPIGVGQWQLHEDAFGSSQRLRLFSVTARRPATSQAPTRKALETEGAPA